MTFGCQTTLELVYSHSSRGSSLQTSIRLSTSSNNRYRRHYGYRIASRNRPGNEHFRQCFRRASSSKTARSDSDRIDSLQVACYALLVGQQINAHETNGAICTNTHGTVDHRVSYSQAFQRCSARHCEIRCLGRTSYKALIYPCELISSLTSTEDTGLRVNAAFLYQ